MSHPYWRGGRTWSYQPPKCIHGEEDGGVLPIVALHDFVELGDSPILARAYAAHVGVLVVEVLIHEPRHGRQRVVSDIAIEVGGVHDLAPHGTVANVFYGVEHRPYFGPEVEVRAIELPVDPSGEQVRNSRDIEARENTFLRATRLIEDRHHVAAVLVATPVGPGQLERGVVHGPSALRSQREEVSGETRR